MSDGITPLTPVQVAVDEQQVANEGYVKKDLIGLDQFTNVILGGSPDETISSRMARWDTEDKGVKHKVGEVVSKGLDLFQKDHGAQAETGDLERAKIVTNIEEEAQ
jgi:hypothetical protein